MDNWSSEFNFDFINEAENNVKLRDFCVDGRWDFERLRPLIGDHLVGRLYDNAPVLTENKDVIRWSKNPSGLFSTKSAWDAIRQVKEVHPILLTTWQLPIPLKSKLLVWKIMKNIIPVDVKAQTQGIQLASKCCCCTDPNIETLHHVFIEDENASSLWNFFGVVFGVPIHQHHSITARLALWYRRCRGSSQFSCLGRTAATAICRQLWSFRNYVVYGGFGTPLKPLGDWSLKHYITLMP